MSSTPRVDLSASVAGEEDPGASNEVGSARERPGRDDQPAGKRPSSEPTEAARTMAPGDEAPPGTAGTGDNVCPDCGGSGRRAGGLCPTCLGKGTVTVGIGGA